MPLASSLPQTAAPQSTAPQGASDESGHELPLLAMKPPGPRSRELTARLDARDCPAFAKRRNDRAEVSGEEMGPIVLARGRGSNLWDVDDNRYVDLAAGFGSVLLGHGASVVTRAIADQSDRLMQGLGDLYSSDVKIALVERLASLHPSADARVLLGQSGADAISAALKSAVLATGRPGVLAFEGAYHGLSYGPLAACGFKESYRAPFAAQLNPSVEFVPYPRTPEDADESLARAERALAKGRIGAVLVEPVLGRGGLVVPPEGFLSALTASAHRHGALVVADEIWTGLGRSGSMAHTKESGVPVDILCLGKGLGGSLSISACVASSDVMSAWSRGGEVVHTSTHAGSPLACAAALAVLGELASADLPRRARDVGALFTKTLASSLEGAPGVTDVRGVGLMVGVELTSGDLGLKTLRGLLERGWIATSGGRAHEVVVFTPPLTVAVEQLEGAAHALGEILRSGPRP